MTLTLNKIGPQLDLDAMKSPAGYLVEDSDLVAAANAAIALGKPLLLTGEPGIGKSQFASWMAAQSPASPFYKFVIKSTTDATDLFFQFDTLARFRDAQIGETTANQEQGIEQGHRYLRYNALGMAILLSLGRERALSQGLISKEFGELVYNSVPVEPTRSVVLIDEIDKAPRDVPNDVLDEIDHLSFRVPEIGNIQASADPQFRPIVIMTSNSERDLPKPFLRRCIYYHMQLSNDDGVLRRIAEQRVGARYAANGSLLGEAIGLFRYVRSLTSLRHQPGLAELLDWLADLSSLDFQTGAHLEDISGAKVSFKTTMLKDPADQRLVDNQWPEWLTAARQNSSQSQ